MANISLFRYESSKTSSRETKFILLNLFHLRNYFNLYSKFFEHYFKKIINFHQFIYFFERINNYITINERNKIFWIITNYKFSDL